MRYPPGLTISLRLGDWLRRNALRSGVRRLDPYALVPLRVGPRRAVALGVDTRTPNPDPPPGPPAGWEYPPAPEEWEGSNQEWWEQAEVGQEWDADGTHYTKTGPWEFSEEPSG